MKIFFPPDDDEVAVVVVVVVAADAAVFVDFLTGLAALVVETVVAFLALVVLAAAAAVDVNDLAMVSIFLVCLFFLVRGCLGGEGAVFGSNAE